MTSGKASLQKRVASLGSTAFRHYKRELHQYLLRRLRRPQDVDDLAQEVHLRLLRVDDEKTVRKPLAYLYGVASNVVADFRIGSEQEREHVTIDSEVVEKWSEDPTAVLPDDLAERLNLQQQLNRVLRQLPPSHAAVLLAHKRDGMSYEEVAVKLGLSVHTVEKYITQAKARIRTNREEELLVAERATEWLDRLRSAEPHERAAFSIWLRESPRNVREILLAIAWDVVLDQIDPNHEADLDELRSNSSTNVVPVRLVPVRLVPVRRDSDLASSNRLVSSHQLMHPIR